MLTAEAHIATDRASDYLSKLCRHVERIGQTHSGTRLQVEWSELRGTASFGGGRCTLHAEAGTLIVRVEAADADSLRRVESLVAERLETFGSGEGLTVTWSNL